ncbi:tetratricopeptide repeat protein [Streptomyces macrosporus]|uniref:Tetratricopeptide repeat protein n=1 Tax=Streptomyces macrosporus TaxID=44032 RepID=A0ABN3KRU5_9ACTN
MDSGRVVQVKTPGTWGSGYEILPGLVLTAAHAVDEVGSPVRVRRAPDDPEHSGRVVWRGGPCASDARGPERRGGRYVDAALVHVEDPGRRSATTDATEPDATERPRWGRIVGERVRVECRVWGFSRSEHRAGESTQVFGTINPGNGFVGGTYVIDCDTTPPRPAEGSPWGGMSGAAVFCGDLLTGVVTAELPGHLPARLEAEPAAVLLRADGFQDVLDRYGPSGPRVLEPVEYAGLADRDHGTGPDRSPASIMELLHPARGVVPFAGRDEHLARLHEWSRRPGPGVALIHAPGGRGKTRLALEFSRGPASGEEDWAVLWPAPGRSDDVRRMPPPAMPLLVVVDGADSRVEETAAVLEFAVRHRSARIKVVLLARSDGWWNDLRGREPSLPVATLMSGALTIALPDLETDAAAQRRSYRSAVRAFASALKGVPEWEHHPWETLAGRLSPPGPGDHLGSPLTLHMTALVDLLNASLDASDTDDTDTDGTAAPRAADPRDGTAAVEERLLAHERSHWVRIAAAHGLRQPALSEDALFNAVAAMVVLRPRDQDQADALIRRVHRLAGQSEDRLYSVLSWLRSVLPPAAGRPVGDLQPDRLAERFVGERLVREPKLADGLLSGATPDQAARFLTLATRAAARGVLGRELTDWCVRHRDVLALPAIDVATRVEEPEPLLDALGAVVDDPGTSLPDLERLAARLPRSTQNLAPWALRLHKRIVEVHREQAGDVPEGRARLAVALRELSKRLGSMGEREESLRVNQEAIDLWRALPAHLPGRRAELGACHNNAVLCHSALGRRKEALQAALTAVELLREEARSGDPVALGHFSRGLSSLAWAQSELGDNTAALRTTEECVKLRRDLYELCGRDEESTSLLADGLQSLAGHLMECGLRKEALTAAEEAVALHDDLAAAHPDAFRPGLAAALATLSAAARLMGLRSRALEAAREAVAIRRRLADARPEVYRADLAHALNSLAIDLMGLGLHDEALAAGEESVELFRDLAVAHPPAHTPDLALALNSLANSLLDHEERERALETAEEAVRTYRELDAAHPGAFRDKLAVALVTLSLCQERTDRPDEARASLEEAESIYRPLADAAPDAYRPGLAGCLNNLSSLLWRTGEFESALRTVEESIAINSRLARGRAGAFADALAKNWMVKYHCLVLLNRLEEAAPAGAEAVRRLRALVRSAPGRYESDLAMVLSSTGVLLQFTGQRERALRRAREAVAVGRRLADGDPGRHRAGLAEYLEKYGDQLWLLDRRGKALATAEEVFVLRREVRDHRGTDDARSAAARAAMLLGNRLVQCGRRADALPPTREAEAEFRALHAAGSDPHGTTLSSLSSALCQLAVLLLHAGDGEAALGAAAEAVGIGRAAAGPGAAPDLTTAAALTTYGRVAAVLGEDGAPELLEKAVALCRALPDRAGPGAEMQLAEALGCFGWHLAAVPERHPEALRAAGEAVAIHHRLVGAFPVLRSSLALSLASHGLRLAEAGRAREAADATEEALALARLLAREHRRGHRDVLALALAAFARARLLTGDRSDRAREASAEAVALLRRIARDEPAATAPYLREARDTHDRLRR